MDDFGSASDLKLTPAQVRVLGCLIEKQLTTPQQYPLSLNGLTLACNQSSNRHPVVSYEEPAVELAVRTLKQAGLTRFVHPTHGRSVLRYEHVLDTAFGLDERQLALLAVLFLRGPQTLGELRSRSERMIPLGDLAEVAHEIELLEVQAGGLLAPLARRPGQKEGRYRHLFDDGDPDGDGGTSDVESVGRNQPGGDQVVSGHEAVVPLAVEVASLRTEVTVLARLLDEVRTALGLDPVDE